MADPIRGPCGAAWTCHSPPVADAVQQLRSRIGSVGTGGARSIRLLARLVEGEKVRAAVVGYLGRRYVAVAATDAGLRLARHPYVAGPAWTASHSWEALTGVRSASHHLDLVFGSEEVHLNALSPHGQFGVLLDVCRGRLRGAGAATTVEELRELAARKLGRWMTFSLETALDGLPDRLETDEHVQRLAASSVAFDGLLVLTDRRLLLLAFGMRRSSERWWELPRSAILGAEDDEAGGLRLLTDDGDVVLHTWTDPERRDEFLRVLGRAPSEK